MTIWVYTGDRPSNGAKVLSALQGFRRLRFGKLVKPQDCIVNWGSTKQVPFKGVKVLNQPQMVHSASNKHKAFEAMAEAHVSTVPWTVDHSIVDQWSEEHCTIVGRQTLTGHSGQGIIIIEKDEPIQPALLYTKYIFKIKEYRVHVVCGKVVDTQQKVRDPNKVPLSWKVRSHDNGFIFTRNTLTPDHGRDSLAISACLACGLDFGAVDIIEDKHGGLYVLEINTAPGLEGQTIQSYGAAFKAQGQA